MQEKLYQLRKATQLDELQEQKLNSRCSCPVRATAIKDPYSKLIMGKLGYRPMEIIDDQITIVDEDFA
jgi:hypothetical protein